MFADSTDSPGTPHASSWPVALAPPRKDSTTVELA